MPRFVRPSRLVRLILANAGVLLLLATPVMADIIYTATLDGPTSGTASEATGTAIFTLNEAATEVSYVVACAVTKKSWSMDQLSGSVFEITYPFTGCALERERNDSVESTSGLVDSFRQSATPRRIPRACERRRRRVFQTFHIART